MPPSMLIGLHFNKLCTLSKILMKIIFILTNRRLDWALYCEKIITILCYLATLDFPEKLPRFENDIGYVLGN